MLDNATPHQNRLKSAHPHLAGKVMGDGAGPPEGGEGACAAFGYLRGLHERASAIEFRMMSGNSVWFPYNWMGTVKFDPSAGLLLKFSGDLVYLVLIRGSNLDKRLAEGGIDLIRAGLQRHRVMWVREMGEDEIQQTGENGPTIDSIEVVEFESQKELKEWLNATEPPFGSGGSAR